MTHLTIPRDKVHFFEVAKIFNRKTEKIDNGRECTARLFTRLFMHEYRAGPSSFANDGSSYDSNCGVTIL